MNENLNLVEILKDCPKGIKLYSTIFGKVKFSHVENDTYPIVLDVRKGFKFRVSQDGRYINDFNGECTLFPSKDQRDWSKFKLKQYRLAPIHEFKDGDILATNSGLQVFVLQRQKSDKEGSCYIGYDFELNDIFFGGEWKFSKLATKEEKEKLFDTIKERGYRWNAKTKTLEKLIKPKFDPKTLKPFDKVLVRDDCKSEWQYDLFSHINDEPIYEPVLFHYKCTGCSYRYCIPYNDETKHLLGTKDEAPEYYRYLED